MPEGAEETTEECIARGELRNSTAGEYLISGFDAEYGGVERNVRAPRVYSAGQNFKTWLSQFLQYANLVHIKPPHRRAYLLTVLEQLANKVVELLKLSESPTFEEFTSRLVENFIRARQGKIINCSCEPGVKGRMRISKDLPIM